MGEGLHVYHGNTAHGTWASLGMRQLCQSVEYCRTQAVLLLLLFVCVLSTAMFLKN